MPPKTVWSPTVTNPESPTLLASVTWSPSRTLWARCTPSMMKQPFPTTVSHPSPVALLIVTFSRMTLSSPMRTQDSSPLYPWS